MTANSIQKDFKPRAQNVRRPASRLCKQALVVTGGAALCAVVLAIVSGSVGATHVPPAVYSDPRSVEPELRALQLPRLSDSVDTAIAEEADAVDSGTSHSVKIKSGDTLAAIFKRLGLSAATVHAVVNSSSEAATLADIRPGQSLRVRLDKDGKPVEIEHQFDRISGLRLRRDAAGAYVAEPYQQEVDVRVAYAHGTIEESLFLAGQRAGLSNALIMEMADIFGWDVDFVLDIRSGDEFTVVYEEFYLDGEKLRDGAIIAAEFVNRGRRVRAIRHLDTDGIAAYYTPDGLSMRKAFLRSPVKFARISSHFNLRRKHPILHKIRAHKGVDYAAASGTPIMASGDGKVVHAGRKGGYGTTVIIQHGQKYTTLYAHLRRLGKGIRRGSRVRQGQVIGYVGKSGLATGPHLHYEFRVNGVHKNPLTVKLPQAKPIAAEYRAEFETLAASRVQELGNYGRLVAALDR